MFDIIVSSRVNYNTVKNLVLYGAKNKNVQLSSLKGLEKRAMNNAAHVCSVL